MVTNKQQAVDEFIAENFELDKIKIESFGLLPFRKRIIDKKGG